MAEKKCRICGVVQPASEFNIKTSSKDGLQSKCKTCQKLYKNAHYQRNRERALEVSRENYWANIETNRAQARARLMWNKYKITPEAYYEMLAEQNGVCLICGGTGGMSHMLAPLVVDHDHETGTVRGLLCSHCNTGLGRFKDSIELLAKAIQYLSRSSNG